MEKFMTAIVSFETMSKLYPVPEASLARRLPIKLLNLSASSEFEVGTTSKLLLKVIKKEANKDSTDWLSNGILAKASNKTS
jgi:hypothetical protein